MNIEFNVKGTEKQIAWCRDILKDFNHFFETIEERDIFKKMMSDKESQFYDNYSRNYDILKNVIQMINNENASYIIENRFYFEKNKYDADNEKYDIKKYEEIIEKYIEEKEIKRYSCRFLSTIRNNIYL